MVYKQILVAVDNSEWSDCAVDLSLALARACGAALTANHVYAAKLHDLRFRQLEPGLPERYQTEEMLARQRGIHDSLIGRGLVLISASYLDAVEGRCREAGVAFTRQTGEGRNYEEILRAAGAGPYDLLALGAHGLGKSKRALIGSVCERVARGAKVDVLVVRRREPLAGGRIAVALDGSDCAFAAVRRAIGLAKVFAAHLTAVAVYDPFFHRVAFNSVAGVLSAEAAKLFRFREQEVLHDEIIDKGLMRLYQTHLDRAATMAAEAGVAMQTLVLRGKPYDALLDYAEAEQPALLVMGRTGFHAAAGGELGSNAANALRLAGGNVLIVSERAEDRATVPEAQATSREGSLTWTPEASARLERIPAFVRPMARRVVERYARENGQTTITPTVVDEARHRFGL